jgi:hypothetical protein
MDGTHIKRWEESPIASWRSTAGASFLIALIFVLVATVVAAVITTSSSVNVERNKQHAAEEQSYLAVVSALNTAKAAFLNDGATSSLVVSSSDSSSDASASTGSEIGDWVVKRAKSKLGVSGYNYTDALTVYVTATNPYNGSTLQTVKLVYDMKSDYTITIQGSVVDDDTDDSNETSNSADNGNYVSTTTDYDNTLATTISSTISSDATEVWWYTSDTTS